MAQLRFLLPNSIAYVQKAKVIGILNNCSMRCNMMQTQNGRFPLTIDGWTGEESRCDIFSLLLESGQFQFHLQWILFLFCAKLMTMLMVKWKWIDNCEHADTDIQWQSTRIDVSYVHSKSFSVCYAVWSRLVRSAHCRGHLRRVDSVKHFGILQIRHSPLFSIWNLDKWMNAAARKARNRGSNQFFLYSWYVNTEHLAFDRRWV